VNGIVSTSLGIWNMLEKRSESASEQTRKKGTGRRGKVGFNVRTKVLEKSNRWLGTKKFHLNGKKKRE